MTAAVSTPSQATLPTFVLARLRQNSFATYGEIIDDTHAVICVTLELPWRNNERDRSCIPPRPQLAYVCERRWSNKHGKELWWITGVEDRDDCELHIGDLPCDTEGCVLLGTAFGYVEYPDNRPDGKGNGITGSGPAFDRFMNLTKDLTHLLLLVLDPMPLAVAD